MPPTDSLCDERQLDRRTALGAFGALAALTLGFPRLADASSRLPVWRLDPVHRQGPGAYAARCTGCRACRRHARNKVFATREAAISGRAHANCHCVVVRTSLRATTHGRLFGPVDARDRDVVDRRWPWVRKALGKTGGQ